MRDKFCDSRLIVWQIVLSLLATCNISRQHFSLARSSFQMNQSLLGEDQKKSTSQSLFSWHFLFSPVCIVCQAGNDSAGNTDSRYSVLTPWDMKLLNPSRSLLVKYLHLHSAKQAYPREIPLPTFAQKIKLTQNFRGPLPPR